MINFYIIGLELALLREVLILYFHSLTFRKVLLIISFIELFLFLFYTQVFMLSEDRNILTQLVFRCLLCTYISVQHHCVKSSAGRTNE
jgi:hypothetical protein